MILCVDVLNTLYRGSFGVGRKLSTPSGFEITPTYGFIKVLIGLLRRFPNTTKLVLCSDPMEQNRVWRKTLYPGYKRNRKDANPKQKKLREVIYANAPYVKQLFQLINCAWYEDQEFEADDQMAMVAAHAQRTSQNCIIVSGDRDMLQLVEMPFVQVCYPTKKDYVVVNHNNFESLSHDFINKKGKTQRTLDVRPFMFWRALVGDKSDNIDGIATPVLAHDIVSSAYAPEMANPTEMILNWIAMAPKGLPKKQQAIADLDPVEVAKVIDRNWSLIQLRSDEVQTRDYYYGSWSPREIESWFRQVNFRSLLSGGDSYQHFTSTLGRLQPCLL